MEYIYKKALDRKLGLVQAKQFFDGLLRIIWLISDTEPTSDEINLKVWVNLLRDI